MINTIFYFALSQADYDRVKSTINPRTISFVPQSDGSGIIYKAGIPYSGSGDLDYSKVVNIIKLYFGSDDFEWPELPDPSDIHGGNSYATYIDNSINNSLLEFAAGEKERVLGYINDKDAQVQALVENIFKNYQELINHYLETGDSNFSAFTFGDPDLVEWMSILGHVTDNQDGTYSVNWSDILQTISQFQADVNQVLANPTLFGNEWYDTEKVWNLENDTVNENDNTFKGFYTNEDTLKAVKANIGDWAVLTVDDRSTVWRYGKPVEIDYDVLSSALYTYIEDNYTSSGMSSTWAKVLGKVDEFDEETRTVLEWMASDVKTWAGGFWYNTKVVYNPEEPDEENYPTAKYKGEFESEEALQAVHGEFGDWATVITDEESIIWKYSNMTYADVMTAAREYAADGETILQEAAAGLHTLVKKNNDGEYEASTLLSSLVSDGITAGLAGLELEAMDDEVVAALYAHVDQEVDNKISDNQTVKNINSAVAGLQSSVSTAEGKINDLEAAVTTAQNSLEAKADASQVYTKTEIDGTVQTLTNNVSSASELAQTAQTTFTNWKDDTTNGFAAFKTSTQNSLNSKASASSIENLQGLIDDLKDDVDNLGESEVITYTDVNGWIRDGKITWNGSTGTTLKSKIETMESSIGTKVTKDADGRIESSAYISAKNIDFGTEKVPFDNLNITGLDIVGVLSGIKLSVDNIDITSLTGDTTLINALNSKLSLQKLIAGTVNDSTLITGVSADSTGLLVRKNSSYKSAEFKADGSGSLANGAISWTTDGTITLGTAFVDTLNTTNIVANTLNAVNGVKKITADSSSLSVTNGTQTAANFSTAGSGSLANGKISWNTVGDISFDSTVTIGSVAAGVGRYRLNIYTADEIGILEIKDYANNEYGDRKVLINGNDHTGGHILLWSPDYDAVNKNGSELEMTPLSFNMSAYDGDYRYKCDTDPIGGIAVSKFNKDSNSLVSCTIYANNGAVTTSDMTLKNVVSNLNLSIENVANAPLFKFTWKNGASNNINIGTSAQYWNDILPETVEKDDNDKLSLNYATVATASAITAAREIVSLKNRIKELEDEILLLLDAANK